MNQEDLDLGPLQRAADALDEALTLLTVHQGSSAEKKLLRDGVIQRFEFGFELAWKTLRRYLQVYGLERVDGLTNRELFRLGHEQGVLTDAEAWIVFLKHRNLASHVYDDSIAEQVFSSAKPFLVELKGMLRSMEAHLE
jgi:nucleotidyltransferase substrate binding protein (TIGR01987 family)